MHINNFIKFIITKLLKLIVLKLLFFLLFLIPSLSLGLTFKDGKQVEDEPEILIIEDNKTILNCLRMIISNFLLNEKTNYLDIKLSTLLY